ncbi:hypothetical protein HK104_002533, partial [Borealophlyctis nickersoniae]
MQEGSGWSAPTSMNGGTEIDALGDGPSGGLADFQTAHMCVTFCKFIRRLLASTSIQDTFAFRFGDAVASGETEGRGSAVAERNRQTDLLNEVYRWLVDDDEDDETSGWASFELETLDATQRAAMAKLGWKGGYSPIREFARMRFGPN